MRAKAAINTVGEQFMYLKIPNFKKSYVLNRPRWRPSQDFLN